MFNLAMRSLLVLGLLFGLLFAVLTAALVALDAPMWFAIVIAVVIAGIQFAISPWIIQWIHKIDWRPVDTVDPEIGALIRSICNERRIPEPRFGIIHDGNPNAFTFGHHPGNARVVVTTGLLEVCDTAERRAVVAHELGHIVHWDFVVMTVAATVPLVLYYVYWFGLRSGGGRKRDGGYVALVALGAFVAYIISQYIVLLLSRVREYYADAFAARSTHDANALATGLVKIAYGLARSQPPAKKEEDKAVVPASAAMKAFGIFDPKFGKSMAVATAGAFGLSGDVARPETAVEAMKWDVWNPWAFFIELGSTHPLPAKRIRALGRVAEQMGQVPTYQVPERPPESYWDEFLVDLLVKNLPLLGLIVGAAVGFVLGFSAGMPVTGVAIAVLGLGLGMLLRMAFVYPRNRFQDKQVAGLVPEVEVSAVRPIPARLTGTVLGRGIPGLYWSDDLVVQDESGFMLLQYRQPIGALEFLFGLFRAEGFIGQRIVAEGWYRRAPIPYLELWKVRLPNGEVHTCHNWAFALALSLFVTFGGLLVALFGMIGQF